MTQPLLYIILGFFLGLIAAFLVQRLLRYMRYRDPERKIKLGHLQNIKAWMESYRTLFDCIYPECPELILAHKMLSKQYPHYDKTSPIKLYDALKEYRAMQIKHDALAQGAAVSLQALSDKRLDWFYNLNKKFSSFFQKFRLLKDPHLIFPTSFSADINDHLLIIDDYRCKVFDEFPRKIIDNIEWEKLDRITPDELSTIVHPHLKYYQGSETITRHRVKESRMFDEMQNLSFYRIVAKKEIDAIISKVQEEEKKYSSSQSL